MGVFLVKTMIIADIHGYVHLLNQAIAHFEGLSEDTKLVFLGDYIDRGPSSLECLQVVKILQEKYPNRVTTLKGNHEELFEQFLLTGVSFSSNGIWETIKSFYPYEEVPKPIKNFVYQYKEYASRIKTDYPLLVDYLNTLPLYYMDDNIIAVHAGITEDTLNRKDSEFFLWAREEYFVQQNTFNKPIISGHTPIPNLVKYLEGYTIPYHKNNIVSTPDNKYYIDGGVFSTKKLNTVIFENGVLIDNPVFN